MTLPHELKTIRLDEIKATVNHKIRTVDGVTLSHQEWFHKSLNALETIIKGDNTSDEYASAESFLARKNKLVRHYSQVLKPRIESMTVEELKSFDINDDLWKDLNVT